MMYVNRDTGEILNLVRYRKRRARLIARGTHYRAFGSWDNWWRELVAQLGAILLWFGLVWLLVHGELITINL